MENAAQLSKLLSNHYKGAVHPKMKIMPSFTQSLIYSQNVRTSPVNVIKPGTMQLNIGLKMFLPI